MQRGEKVFAVLLGVFGLVWMWQASRLTYLDDYAPGSGFLPLWAGGLLVALVLLFLWTERRTPIEPAPPGEPRRLWSLIGGLAVTVAVIEPLGFVVPVTAYVLFLARVLERLSWRTSVLLALGTSGVIYGLFKVWLAVPLPRGPWGF